ncbi:MULTISPECIES: protein-L-isoaspartate O-methyltransferase [Bradyrhizobium]|jgi:protein-L-isoaspartate(D-aspartate) O-methyltransferase|uniref:protein-L-isoaspartate O-methyltransferase family protein n=1 Tax=Bradyrhizobium TaxID=374 RepID=UPI0004218F02|nr:MULTISPECIES: protein-L-isoaspartate O-methyltransferase [Bradyrhizobium]AUC97184.1 protein-L-isoaspartate O-methyltransferase [Bradyrhizobium sp. SK17]KIU48247.1 protein-L-isoaspartate O-methyltransferase [Bradyrhizobium elkanii]MBK5650588.1 protein-L-isoaspartate O-methyltransferase [Rhizobium sp.]OCX30722.1 protein-L-isoaspartate O-methyltransferase [Bradyrhizobium sp. UASWS1016]
MTGFSTARQYMVDGQVRPSDVTDDRILEAMLTVPREVFVPASKQALAYLDLDLDVTEGGTAKRYLITPALLARMLQAAEIKATDRVLVVGCATGYAAAVVARFAAEVSATESDPTLVAKATAAVAQLGIQNVTVKTAAAADGDATGAPFDVIVLNGATEIVPTGLFGQLKEGGRLVGVFGLTPPPRATLVTHSHGDFGHRELFDATAPVLPGFEQLPAFVF